MRRRAFFQQLLAALDFCGAIGVANRNLTPEHILLTEESERGGAPRVKLAGFAMSKDENSDSLCKTACGSPGYVAPEARPGATQQKPPLLESCGAGSCNLHRCAWAQSSVAPHAGAMAVSMARRAGAAVQHV